MARTLKLLLALGLLAFSVLLLLWGYARRHPQDMPWTPLDLTQPVGSFTGRKVAALGDEPGRCRGLLRDAGVRFTLLPARADGLHCGYRDAVQLRREAALSIAWRPDGLGTSCQIAAALALWEWHVVQPAALRHFGSKVTAIDHFGGYSCRRIYGRRQGRWSEHARANAVDVAGFRLADGRRISVVADWQGTGSKAAFLHEVRDGACRLFTMTLSPDYNAAHRDHLHLDEAAQGQFGWRGCR